MTCLRCTRPNYILLHPRSNPRKNKFVRKCSNSSLSSVWTFSHKFALGIVLGIDNTAGCKVNTSRKDINLTGLAKFDSSIASSRCSVGLGAARKTEMFCFLIKMVFLLIFSSLDYLTYHLKEIPKLSSRKTPKVVDSLEKKKIIIMNSSKNAKQKCK